MFSKAINTVFEGWWYVFGGFCVVALFLFSFQLVEVSDITEATYTIVAIICLAVIELRKEPIKVPSQIEETINWNRIRGNTSSTLDWELEIKMLQEELDELKASTTDVDRFDALLDLKFVLIGSLGKMALSPTQIEQGYQAVLDANSTKSSTKNSEGKITKPANFVGPEPKLQALLDSRP